jgi:hypothetical protein
MLASVFDSWDKIIKVRSKFDPKKSIPQLKSIFFSCESPSKLIEGLFTNYLNYNYYDEFMSKSVNFLSSLCSNDVTSTFILRTQDYSLQSSNYLPAAYYHHYLSTTEKLRDKYPTLFWDISKGKKENKEALERIWESKQEVKVGKSGENHKDAFKNPNKFHSFRMLSRRQIMHDIIPFVQKYYRTANFIKHTVLNDEQAKQLEEVQELLRVFPIELVKKLTFDTESTRTEKMGLRTFVSKSKLDYVNFRHWGYNGYWWTDL